VKNITELISKLKNDPSPHVVITTHHKPDADALGSSLGLYNFLKKLKIEVSVVSPTDYGDFLTWMPGEDSVINFEKEPEKAITLALDAGYIFCLDFNSLNRINEFGDIVGRSSALKVLIDHHLEPANFDDYRYWNHRASSTCELMYEFLCMYDKSSIGLDTAQCLYAGIMTDTGSFRFDTCTGKTHHVIAELIDIGVRHHYIHEAIYDNFSENRTRFIGYCISNKLEILHEYNTALITVSTDELKKYNIVTGDTEGLVNYGLGIKGIKFAALIIDRKFLVKMSFRSKGDFPANQFASRHFNGGGHFNASGGQSELSLNETVEKFKECLLEWKPLLNNQLVNQ